MRQAVDYLFEILVSVSISGLVLCNQQIIETPLYHYPDKTYRLRMNVHVREHVVH